MLLLCSMLVVVVEYAVVGVGGGACGASVYVGAIP